MDGKLANVKSNHGESGEREQRVNTKVEEIQGNEKEEFQKCVHHLGNKFELFL